jgi:hypothetical protein
MADAARQVKIKLGVAKRCGGASRPESSERDLAAPAGAGAGIRAAPRSPLSARPRMSLCSCATPTSSRSAGLTTGCMRLRGGMFRTLKEHDAYEKEIKTQSEKITKMKADNAEFHDIKQQARQQEPARTQAPNSAQCSHKRTAAFSCASAVPRCHTDVPRDTGGGAEGGRGVRGRRKAAIRMRATGPRDRHRRARRGAC